MRERIDCVCRLQQDHESNRNYFMILHFYNKENYAAAFLTCMNYLHSKLK